MDIVYARSTVNLAHNGQRIPVRAGEPWDAGDPLVARYPDMFADNLSAVRTTLTPSGMLPVERATAAPGERRNTRRTGSGKRD
jgi:hypothetical protein